MEFKRMPAGQQTPEAYRLATLEEVHNNREQLFREGILNNEGARVLDGIAKFPDDAALHKFDVIETGRKLARDLVLEESDILPEVTSDGYSDSIAESSADTIRGTSMPTNMIVCGQSPRQKTTISDLVRNKHLDIEGRRIALGLAFIYHDIEVIYWSIALSSSEEESQLRYQYSSCMATACGERKDDDVFCKLVDLFCEKTKQIEKEDVKMALDYAFGCSLKNEADHAIAIVEIILHKCGEKKEELVYLEIDRVAVSEKVHTAVLAKLLSDCAQKQGERWKGVLKFHFVKLFKEAVCRGYIYLVRCMLQFQDTNEDKLLRDAENDEKSLLHYAAGWRGSESDNSMSSDDDVEAISISLFQRYGKENVTRVDSQGRTVLHIASLSGREQFCKFLVENYELLVNVEDASRQNFLHYAAQGKNGSGIVILLQEKLIDSELVKGRNNKGQTPVHQAAMNGEASMISSLSVFCKRVLSKALMQADYAGQTPLHLAARNGHLETVKVLLNAGSDPLKERDISGKTAIHHIVANRSLSSEDATLLIEELLLHFKDEGKRALLLWISAIGIGTADETKGLSNNLKKFLQDKKFLYKDKDVLEKAASQRNSSLTWELLNRGGDIKPILRNRKFHWVRKQIEKFSEQATDRPTIRDSLGRRILAECIAAHFLNPYIKSPITVSITGGSGMGKTSLMNMIEAEVLITAAALAFPDLWQDEAFKGAKKLGLSNNGKKRCEKITKGVEKLLAEGADGKDRETSISSNLQSKNVKSLPYLLKRYRPEYEAVYKYLACMDCKQLLKDKAEDSVYKSQGQSLGAVPRILTVRFSAGNYREMNEAWAGLAVEITKEIEASMTRAQWLSTCWRNAWTRNPQSVYMNFIFPCLVIAFLVVWMAWFAWLLLEGSNNPQLKRAKYGSIPVASVGILWYTFKGLISVFNPVSKQLSGYFSLHDHSQQLGYQQKVISDIKFLKEQIGKKPNWIFSFISNSIHWVYMCLYWRGPFGDSVKGTLIPKYGSAPEDKLRIIAFVDDLDHCEDEVILRVLWAINLVFRVCEINVVLSMDKNIIETAFKNSSKSPDEDFVDKFISKIIQLPVSLADPADGEWETFLKKELGHEPNLKNNIVNDESSLKKNIVKEEPNDETDSSDGEDQDDEPQPRSDETGVYFIENQDANPPFRNEGTDASTGDAEHVETGCNRCEGCIPSFYNRLKHWLKNQHGFSPCLTKILYWIPGFHQTDSEQHGASRMTEHLMKRIRHVRETLMQSFSDEEIDTFNKLRGYAERIEKLPREWKCYISYHKFARNVVAKKPQNAGKHPSAWRLEFVAWTFVCSQWKREMNILIQDWESFSDVKDKNEKQKWDPSLKDIVDNYRKRQWPAEKGDLHEKEEEKKDRIRLKEALDTVQELSMKGVSGFDEFRFEYEIEKHQGRGHEEAGVGTFKAKKGKGKERWGHLYGALENVQDVSREGIECFQEFRFHCTTRYLTFPKPQ